jgi:hypothetical protein
VNPAHVLLGGRLNFDRLIAGDALSEWKNHAPRLGAVMNRKHDPGIFRLPEIKMQHRDQAFVPLRVM